MAENDGLLNLRFYTGMSQAFSEEFRKALSKKELLDIQMEQANPYYRLDPDVEKLLEIDNPDDY